MICKCFLPLSRLNFHFDHGFLLCKKKKVYLSIDMDFPDSSVSQESVCNAGDTGSIPESRRSPGEGDLPTTSILELPSWLSW